VSDLRNKVILITGGNAGIGKEAAVELARQGATVVITARDRSRGERALDDIRARSGSDAVAVLDMDLARLASVRACAGQFLERYDRLDVLINNAGLILNDRRLTDDGFEMTLGVNHLGHFVFTDLLLDCIKQSAPARIINVSSHAHRKSRGLPFDDLQRQRKYRGLLVYCDSKLANIYYTRELARRLDGTGVTVNALHPGVVATRFGRDGDTRGIVSTMIKVFAPFLRTPAQGAKTTIYLASSPEVEGKTGGYYADCKPATPSRLACDDGAAARLWEISQSLVGQAGG